MKPVDPAEVSALLDGELSAERAEQVHRAMTKDSELRCVFEELSAVHRDLTTCAVAARFQPQISLARSTSFPVVAVFGFAAVVLILRVTAKLVPLGVGVAIQAAALALFLWWVLSCLVRLSQDERWRTIPSQAPNST